MGIKIIFSRSMLGMRINTSLSIFVLVLVAVIMGFGSITPVIAQETVSTGTSDTAIAGPGKAAGPVPSDGTWFEWSFKDNPFEAFGCLPADPFSPFLCVPSTGTPTVFADTPPYTVNCPFNFFGCNLTVTDAFNQGDRFEVFDFGAPIGTTSAVANTGDQCAPNNTDPEDCLLDVDSSSGVFCLQAGPHEISFLPIVVNADQGAAYFKLETAVCGVIGGTMIPLDTTALLLVGAQMNAAWMIPVIVAAIGIGIVIARKL